MEISSDIIEAIFTLLPGFVAMWLFYGLTGHEPRTPFERVIQALVYTVFVRVLVYAVRVLCLWVGSLGISLGSWGDSATLSWGVMLGLFVGFLSAWATNNDWPHSLLRGDGDRWLHKVCERRGFTCQTSHPSKSNWHQAFQERHQWVALHLQNGHRIMGWPRLWPARPDSGHFLLTEPEWWLIDGTNVPLVSAEAVLVPASSVERVEFMCPGEAVSEAGLELLKRAVEASAATWRDDESKPKEIVNEQQSASTDT